MWEHRTIYFATDPVALDHFCWDDIEKQRAAVGMKPVAETAPDTFSTFRHCQPEHIEIAGALGLGVFEDSRMEVRRLALKA